MSNKNSTSVSKPHKTGMKKIFGDLEAEVMKIIWKQKQSTVREVYEQLLLEKNLAYTTVMTVMSRLANKGHLIRAVQGNAYVYKPALSDEELSKILFPEVVVDYRSG